MKWLVIAFISLALGFAASTLYVGGYTELDIYNPYRMGLKLEVKCDWDDLKKKFRYHEFFTVKGKARTIIKVPRTNRKCQIWPQVKWF